MKNEEILRDIINTINESEDLNPMIEISSIKMDTDFSKEMGFDSIALMSLVYDLQEKYPNLNEEFIGLWKSPQDIINSLCAN